MQNPITTISENKAIYAFKLKKMKWMYYILIKKTGKKDKKMLFKV